VSASDISDTDFAVQSEGEKESTSEEADLEDLERARAALQARSQKKIMVARSGELTWDLLAFVYFLITR
jgi:hypothetical protein